MHRGTNACDILSWRMAPFPWLIWPWAGVEPLTSAGPDCCISWIQNCWKWKCGRSQRPQRRWFFPSRTCSWRELFLAPSALKYGGVGGSEKERKIFFLFHFPLGGVNTLFLSKSLPMSLSVGTVLYENESHYVHLITSQYECVVSVKSLFSAVLNLAQSSFYRPSSKHGWN